MEPQVRRVARVIEPQPVVEGAGVRLRRSIGGWALDYLDPFLLLDHFESDDPDDYLAGFPLHPHRGIETVTYMLAGEVDHKDTIGNAGTSPPRPLDSTAGTAATIDKRHRLNNPVSRSARGTAATIGTRKYIDSIRGTQNPSCSLAHRKTAAET